MLGAVIVLGNVFQRSDISSSVFSATFITTLILWLITLWERFDKCDLMVVLIMACSLTSVLINGITQRAAFSFDYLKKLVMFNTTIVYFASAGKLTLTRETQRFLRYIYVIIAVGLIYAYMVLGRTNMLISGEYSQYLTFGFTNPNLLAFFLLCFLMFLCVMAVRERKLIWKIVLLAAAAVEGVFLYLTKSRNAMISMCLFGICTVAAVLLRKRTRKLPGWLVAAISASPMLFAAVYLSIVNNSKITNALSFIASEGKDLDSRAIIWRRALNRFSDSPIFGEYFQISGGLGYSQMHNTHIDILSSYGLVVFIFTCVFLFFLIRRIEGKTCGVYGRLTLFGFTCAIFLGAGEATLFSGGLGGYLFAGAFLLTMEDTGKGDALIEARNGQRFL